jgi:hypothetical protein
MNFQRKIKNIPVLIQLIFIMGIACCALILRMGSGYLPENYLWAEDGSIFMTQANSMGIESIFKPYAGYLHVFPRTISYIASFFDMVHQPYILFMGWLFSFLLLITLAILSAKNYGLSFLACCFLTLLIVLQPSYGDVFFNITNSQWMIGAALSIYILTFEDLNLKRTVFSYFTLSIACITGPFSIFMAPILLIKGLINKNINQNLPIYLIVVLGALIQGVVMVNSGRLTVPVVAELKNWVDAIRAFFLFGANKPITYIAGALFWLGYLSVLFFGRGLRVSKLSRINVPILFLITAMLYFIGEIYTGRGHPQTEFPFGGAQRYGWIPYTLIFCSAMIAVSPFKDIQTVVVSCIGCICLVNFHSIVFPNLNFRSYANFSKYADVSIPINPYNDSNKWAVINYQKGKEHKHIADSDLPPGFNKIPIDLGLVSGLGYVKQATSDNSLRAISLNNDPMIALNSPIDCQSAKDVGVSIEINRSSSSPIQLFWSNTIEHSETKSLRRFYPEGNMRVDFAFPNPLGKIYLRLDPQETSGNFEIKSFTVYCLP